MGKSLSSKYIQKLLGSTKKSAMDVLKTVSKRATQKAAETTVDFIGDKIAEEITKAVSNSICKDPGKSLAQIDGSSIKPIGIRKEKYILPERWQQIIDELRLL